MNLLLSLRDLCGDVWRLVRAWWRTDRLRVPGCGRRYFLLGGWHAISSPRGVELVPPTVAHPATPRLAEYLRECHPRIPARRKPSDERSARYGAAGRI